MGNKEYIYYGYGYAESRGEDAERRGENNFFCAVLALLITAVMAFSACTVTGTLYEEYKAASGEPELKTMTVSTNKSGKVTLTTSGDGTVVIDWGDGTAAETSINTNSKIYEHVYTGANTRTITIKGENITRFNCSGNEIQSLNLSDNTALTELYCSNNRLASLNIETNTALKYLDCSVNQLEELNMSANREITTLFCNDNKLKNMSLQNNTKLTILNCSNNLLDAAAIYALLQSLHGNAIPGETKILFINNNPGIDEDDGTYKSMAEAKGWRYN